MQIVMFLVPLMLLLVVGGLVLFSWAVKNGQYDDLEGPAHRILYDDDNDMIPKESRQSDPEPGDDQDSENNADQPDNKA